MYSYSSIIFDQSIIQNDNFLKRIISIKTFFAFQTKRFFFLPPAFFYKIFNLWAKNPNPDAMGRNLWMDDDYFLFVNKKFGRRQEIPEKEKT